jgi:hypothetical protein
MKWLGDGSEKNCWAIWKGLVGGYTFVVSFIR